MSARETILRPGVSREAVAIATLAAAGDRPCRTGVVFLNAGLVHRVGPGRLWVQAARRIAALGLPALRLDFAGVGDSPESAASERFEARAPAEARAAIDALAQAAGIEDCVLIGLCSGAEIAFKTALLDARVRAIVLVNAPRFLEEPDAALVRRLEERQSARYYWTVALKNPRSWIKALTGRAQLGSILRAVFARRGTGRATGSGTSGGATESADARAFRSLAERRVAIHLVLSAGDWAEDYLAAVLGQRALEDPAALGLRVLRIPGTDHLLTPLAAQRAFLETLESWAVEWRNLPPDASPRWVEG